LIQECQLGLTQNQIYDFIRSIDQHDSGFINFEEVVSRFSLDLKKGKVSRLKPEEKDDVKKLVTQLGVQIFSDNSVRRKVRNAYKLFPSTKQGILFEQFSLTLKKLKTVFTDNEVQLLFDYIDADRNGVISYSEFKKVFKFVDKKLSTWTNPEIFSEIQARKSQILVDFVTLDVRGTGMISMKDFAAVCQQMKFKHLTNKDINEMSKILVDKDGMIDYNQFLGCFEIDFFSNLL